MLKVEGLTGGYGSSKVLFGMAFEAAEGEVISLIGRNGMGKTTTIKTLMGMLPATGGQVRFRGQTLARPAPSVVARLGVGLVPEGRRVFGSLSVEENLVATSRAAPGGWDPVSYTHLDVYKRQTRGGDEQHGAVSRWGRGKGGRGECRWQDDVL